MTDRTVTVEAEALRVLRNTAQAMNMTSYVMAIDQGDMDHFDRVAVTALSSVLAERDELQDQLHEAETKPWPHWAEAIRKKLAEYGYDGGPEDEWDIGEMFGDWIDGCIDAAERKQADRVGILEEALRQQRCIRPCNNRPDDFTVGQCSDAGECGCGAATALGEG